MLGYTQEELKRIEFPTLVHQDNREENLAEIRRQVFWELPFFEIENPPAGRRIFIG